VGVGRCCAYASNLVGPRHFVIAVILIRLSGVFIFNVVGVSGGRGGRVGHRCRTSVDALITVIIIVGVLCPPLWWRKIPPVVVVVLHSNDGTSYCPPPPPLLRCSSPLAPLHDDISTAVVTLSSSSPCPLSSCHLMPVQVAASATTLPSLHPLSPKESDTHRATLGNAALPYILSAVQTASPFCWKFSPRAVFYRTIAYVKVLKP
jgi:hypothetical protein